MAVAKPHAMRMITALLLFGTRSTAFLRPLAIKAKCVTQVSCSASSAPAVFRGNITVLDQGAHHLVVSKPPSVVCHHSEFTGSRAQNEVPMLQRVRQAMGRKVNLVHRLDRGCSGCLLLTYTDDDITSQSNVLDNDSRNPTAILSDSTKETKSQKTYLALVRGEGILHGRDFKQEGWFKVERAIKNEKGAENDAVTWFRFVAGQDNDRGNLSRPRASLVLCRPESGRWHQIRRHLNGLSHPILGDSTHGNSNTNREWRKLGMPTERTCLHLIHLNLGPTSVTPKGINVAAPLPPDMMTMLKDHLPRVLEDSRPILNEEGIDIESKEEGSVLPFSVDIF